MLDATTRAMAANAITMLAAEYTETGYAAEGLRERIASIATFADIRHDDLRPLLRCGWEEGAVCLRAEVSDEAATSPRLVLAARYLGLTSGEVLETEVGRHLDQLGLLTDGVALPDPSAAERAS